MRNARLFAVSSVFAYRALFNWLSPSAYLFQKMGFPLVQLAFFAFIGRFGGAQPLEFYLIGNSIIVGFQAMFGITSAISGERWQGTLPYLVGSPANRPVLFFGRGAVHVLDGVIDLLAAFTFAVVLFGLDLSHATWPGMVLAVAVASLAACSMGLFLGAAAYLVLDAAFLANFALFAIVLLTGANVPLAELPSWAQAISWSMPLTRTVAAARGFAAGGSLVEGLPLLAGDLALALVWGLAGLALFGWVETQARRRGTLEGF
jgi:ABC-2 type transport system permease protein